MAAALSYYALFSLFPLLLVVLVLATALLLLASLVSNIVIKVILNLVNTFQDTFALWEIDQEALSRGLQAGWSYFWPWAWRSPDCLEFSPRLRCRGAIFGPARC